MLATRKRKRIKPKDVATQYIEEKEDPDGFYAVHIIISDDVGMLVIVLSLE